MHMALAYHGMIFYIIKEATIFSLGNENGHRKTKLISHFTKEAVRFETDMTFPILNFLFFI